jgi:hypothetical protein
MPPVRRAALLAAVAVRNFRRLIRRSVKGATVLILRCRESSGLHADYTRGSNPSPVRGPGFSRPA